MHMLFNLLVLAMLEVPGMAQPTMTLQASSANVWADPAPLKIKVEADQNGQYLTIRTAAREKVIALLINEKGRPVRRVSFKKQTDLYIGDLPRKTYTLRCLSGESKAEIKIMLQTP